MKIDSRPGRLRSWAAGDAAFGLLVYRPRWIRTGLRRCRLQRDLMRRGSALTLDNAEPGMQARRARVVLKKLSLERFELIPFDFAFIAPPRVGDRAGHYCAAAPLTNAF